MARQFKRYVRRVYKNRKAIVRNTTSAWSLAKGAWNAAMAVKNLINVERKFCDSLQSALQVTNGGGVFPLISIAQGADYNQRNGNSIKLTSFYLRYFMNVNVNQPYTQLRLIIVRDTEGRGSTPAVTDILEASNVVSPLNHINGMRFKVIYDKLYSFSNTGDLTRHSKFYLKLHNHVKFKGTTSAVTDQDEGSMFIMLLSDQSVNVPTINYYSRLRYIDN